MNSGIIRVIITVFMNIAPEKFQPYIFMYRVCYQADKRNSFTDRRFGEDDTSLTVEDKYLKRFQQERIKKTKFSLQVLFLNIFALTH